MTPAMRDFIISEIKRIAAETGVAPGREVFARETGITPAKWTGIHWLRWGDALAEAGFARNVMTQKRDSRDILEHVAALTRTLKRLPTGAEIKMHRLSDPAFPAHSTVSNHFSSKAKLAAALRQLASEEDQWADLLEYVPAPEPGPMRRPKESREGMVYLLRSGRHYKIGHSDNIERRFREVTIALPEAVTLVHAIRTDDPSGIEAYWHRRFADKRANGEWFALTGDDVSAFRKRTFQ
jgi:hypothetical protein